MAYADKSCDMRRCCIVRGGHVKWEGVLIDDETFILNGRYTDSGFNTDKLRVLEVINEWNQDLTDGDEQYILLYQDGEDCNWHVSKDYLNCVKENTSESQGGKK